MNGDIGVDESVCAVDSNYFHSYDDVKIHELMLKDKSRTLAYKTFIEQNGYLFRNKVVMDVGAGTGILSLFLAKVGVKKVYAIEASNIASACSAIVEKNGFSDVIEVINKPVEEVDFPPDFKVDIIVSEWMGFYLLHESMLDSVLLARDRWLRSDGVMLPSSAVLYFAPVNMDKYVREHFSFWNDVYGFDFSPLIPSAFQTCLQQPTITVLDETNVIEEPQIALELDLLNIKSEEVEDICQKFEFSFTHPCAVHGFSSWFDVQFSCSSKFLPDDEVCRPVTLSTSPSSAESHWKQTVFFLPEPISVRSDSTLCCKMQLTQDVNNARRYNISIEMLKNLDDDDDDNDDDDDSEEIYDCSEHPTPCDCDAPRCKIIKALMAKYETEQDQMASEAKIVDITAEVAAAVELDDENIDFEYDADD